MKLSILDAKKAEIGKEDLPEQFEEEIRPDLIKRAVLAILVNKRQPYGADSEAGKRASVRVSKRRKNYRGSYGHGISRVPRKVLSRRGMHFNWTGAFAPGMVGGRRAHPPKAEKVWQVKINRKERQKAIRSALAATINIDCVKNRGHFVPESFPFIIDDKIENMEKTRDVKKVLVALGFERELVRNAKKTVRSGKGKRRGRKYKEKRGILIVVSKNCKLEFAAQNIPGVEVQNVKKLNAEILAPGTVPGRLTVFTEGAIKTLREEKLFV